MSYDNISLKQAVFASTDLYDWFLEVARGELARKPISIILADSEGSEVRLVVRRPGEAEPLVVDLTRETIDTERMQERRTEPR